MTGRIKRKRVAHSQYAGIVHRKIPGLHVQQGVVEFMQAAIFFLEKKIVFYLIVLFVDAPGDFIGNTQKLGPVKLIVRIKEPKRHYLQYQESEKSPEAADEEKYVTHSR